MFLSLGGITIIVVVGRVGGGGEKDAREVFFLCIIFSDNVENRKVL